MVGSDPDPDVTDDDPGCCCCWLWWSLLHWRCQENWISDVDATLGNDEVVAVVVEGILLDGGGGGGCW